MQKLLLVTIFALIAVVLAGSKSHERKDLYEWKMHPKEWIRGKRANHESWHQVTVALPAKNVDKFEELFWKISTPGNPMYRKFLTTEQVTTLVDPGVEVRGPIEEWLRSVRNVKFRSFGDFIKVNATVQAIEELFNTKMYEYTHVRTGKSLLRHAGKSSVPHSVRKHIAVVEGLHEFPKVKKPRVSAGIENTGNGEVGTYPFISNNFISSFRSMYDIPSNITIKSPNCTNGVFAQYAADGIPQISDLQLYDTLNGLPKQTYTYNGMNDTSTGLEASLDLQMMTSIAPNGHTTFFMQQAWMYTFVTDLISMGTSAPLVISVSYGWAEDQECSDILHDVEVCQQHGWSTSQYVNATDLQFMKFGATGHTFVVCSQDEGAPGEENDDCSLDDGQALFPEYPGSSRYVLAVGATAVKGSGNNIGADLPGFRLATKSAKAAPGIQPPCVAFNCTVGHPDEVPCMLPNAIFTTGGGFSRLDPMPAYQQAAVQHYLSTVAQPTGKFITTNRAYPDVGAIGQNVPIVYSGNWLVTGGTSASTPIIAGIMTLLNDYLLSNNKAPLGFPNPLLYQMAAAQPNAFNPVKSGNNSCTEEGCCKYGFLANPDGTYNAATGLGSISYTNALAYIKKNLA